MLPDLAMKRAMRWKSAGMWKRDLVLLTHLRFPGSILLQLMNINIQNILKYIKYINKS